MRQNRREESGIEARHTTPSCLYSNFRLKFTNVLPIIREIEAAGATSASAIAAKLNARSVKTARGGNWTHVQIGAVMRRAMERKAGGGFLGVLIWAMIPYMIIPMLAP